MKWLWKNKIHLLVWAVFAVYLLSARQLYVTFFLKDGKPLSGTVSPPVEKGEVRSYIDRLDSVEYDGQELYELIGWVFDPAAADSPQFEKKIVLHSASEDLVFQAQTDLRPDLSQAMPGYPMKLDTAGFRARISKDVLKPGNYRIGFLLEDEQGNIRVFQMINAYIEREPNRLRLITER